MAPIKVLHVTGTGRSGSTLLTNTLGSVPSVFAAGEVRYLWERGVLNGDPCGCGRPGRECPVWGPVFHRLGPAAEPSEARRIERGLQDLIRMRHAGRFFLRRRPLDDAEQQVASKIAAVYRAIVDVTSADVIIDSSKLPTYAAVLDQIPEIDLYVLHLVRDPRAAAWSWARGRSGRSDEVMGRLSPAKSSLLWSVWNGLTLHRWRDRHDRYLRLRYEDVMAAPRTTVRSIASFVGIDPDLLPFVDDDEVVLVGGHVLAGNPNRSETGRVRFRTDRRWESAMRRVDRLKVSLITAPVRGRLGYRSGLRPVRFVTKSQHNS